MHKYTTTHILESIYHICATDLIKKRSSELKRATKAMMVEESLKETSEKVSF